MLNMSNGKIAQKSIMQFNRSLIIKYFSKLNILQLKFLKIRAIYIALIVCYYNLVNIFLL
jgi:hypothetical protein